MSIFSIVTYESEAWTSQSEDERVLIAFEMRYLRSILGIYRRQGKKLNLSIKEELNMEVTIVQVMRRKRIKWFEHVMRPTATYDKHIETPFEPEER